MTPTMEDVVGWLRRAAMSCDAFGEHCTAEEFRSRAAQVEAMGWRPIEEAPKNERILLWAEGWDAPNTGEWAKTGFCPGIGYREWTHQPTHFRPNVEQPVKK